jgi:hypothetical protein
MKRLLVLLLSLVLGSWTLSTCSRQCSTIGCKSAVEIEVPLPQVDWSTIRGLSARVCRNSICASGAFADLPATAEDGLGYGVGLVGWPADEVMTTFVSSAPTLSIGLEEGQLKDGDRYTVTVTDASGATVASFDKTATYTQHEVGANSCGIVCTRAVFQ